MSFGGVMPNNNVLLFDHFALAGGKRFNVGAADIGEMLPELTYGQFEELGLDYVQVLTVLEELQYWDLSYAEMADQLGYSSLAAVLRSPEVKDGNRS